MLNCLQCWTQTFHTHPYLMSIAVNKHFFNIAIAAIVFPLGALPAPTILSDQRSISTYASADSAYDEQRFDFDGTSIDWSAEASSGASAPGWYSEATGRDVSPSASSYASQ